jgi:hypothetical protein
MKKATGLCEITYRLHLNLTFGIANKMLQTVVLNLFLFNTKDINSIGHRKKQYSEALINRLPATRVLLDWIVGLLNSDCNPIWWIGL